MEVEIAQLGKEFRDRYGTAPRFFQAPGRVNLIGEHTDYNEGFVMPFAIDRHALIAGAPRTDSKLRVFARDLNDEACIDLNDEPRKKRGNWTDYAEGIFRTLAASVDGEFVGADVIMTSTVPIGAGLSSSAAIEIGLGLALLSLNGQQVDPLRLGFAGQKVEHEFVGTQSGIMDQFTSVFARAGTAMLLDCRSLDIDYVPIVSDEVEIVVVDTKVKHELANSEYNTRRKECETGVSIFRKRLPAIRSLRDVTESDLAEYRHLFPEIILRRCRHIVTENARTLSACAAFRDGDFETAGQLMTASHASLRSDYDVSCPELDQLVGSAVAVDGVYGARMTGGGFGGCTVNLMRKNAAVNFSQSVRESFASRFGYDPDFYTFRPADGASEVTA